MIRLFDVTKSYPVRGVVLDRVSLEIARGEYVVLCGASGAGKTTLLRVILGEPPDSGEVMVAGRNLARLTRGSIPYLRRNLGVIWQDFKLIGTETVAENVALPLRIMGMTGRAVESRVAQVLSLVGLIDQTRARCRTLSGGEQQRVALARALVNEPDILLADEPTGNLDPAATADVIALLGLAHERGLTVILATHDPQVIAAGQADRIIEVAQGRIRRDEVQAGVRVSSARGEDGGLREVSFVV